MSYPSEEANAELQSHIVDDNEEEEEEEEASSLVSYAEDENDEQCASSENPWPPLSPFACPECFKTFPSDKSLYGHLRCHPGKGYRGVTKPAMDWGPRAKRKRTKEEEEKLHTAAEALLWMSRSRADEHLMHVNVHGSSTVKIHVCNICGKGFGSHQALGGHMASHNKHRRSPDETEAEAEAKTVEVGGHAERQEGRLYKCKVCERVFSTGQKLGGHMRRHRPRAGPSMGLPAQEFAEETSELEPCKVEKNNESERQSVWPDLDLNVEPPSEGDDDCRSL